MERPLKFGLAGTGYWARIVHAPALAATAGIDLTAVWGGNPGAAAALAGSYGCAWFSNFDAFIAEVDAVAFADSVLVADSPFNTPWRRDNGGLWDLAPHVVSLLWASLGPVRAVTADSGAGDVTHLILHHKGGTSSTVTVSIGASEAAACCEAYLWGEAGRSRAPEPTQPGGGAGRGAYRNWRRTSGQAGRGTTATCSSGTP